MTPNSDGPDISHHNPVADWDAIPQYRLFSTKATEGRGFVSPTFHENWEQMRRRAFQYRGCYHWVRSDSPMKDQVANLARALDAHGGLQDGEFIQLDWETTPGIPNVTVNDIEWWITLAEQHWPGRIIVYGSDWVPGFSQWRLRNPATPVWYANYNTSDRSTGGWNESKIWAATVWQWTSSAPIPGIADATCDMNHVFHWDVLDRITNQTSSPPTPPLEDIMAKDYIAQPPASRPNDPWFTKINGVVEYATAADFPNDLPQVQLNEEQYGWMYRSKFGPFDVNVSNWPTVDPASVPTKFTLSGSLTATE